MEKMWENRWNLARILKKEHKNPKTEQLIAKADFVLECGEYLILFRERHRTRRRAFQVRMPKSMISMLRKLAVKEGKSISDIVNEVIESYQNIPPVALWKREVKGKPLMLYLERDIMKKIETFAEELGSSKAEVVRAILEDRLSALNE